MPTTNNQPVLEQIALDVSNMDKVITDTEELIAVARDAGEDVTSLAADLTKQKIRRDKWKDTLQKRGYIQ